MMNYKTNSEVDGTVCASGITSGDIIIGSELTGMEELWKLNRSDSSSTLDYGVDDDTKSTEIDMNEFLNLKSSVSHSNNEEQFETNLQLTPEITGICNIENNSSELIINSPSNSSIDFDNHSLSYITSISQDIKNVMIKKNNILFPVEKVPEDIFLIESNKRNRIKDFIIGDEKYPFEELLLPEQECMLTVTNTLVKKGSTICTSTDDTSNSVSLNSNLGILNNEKNIYIKNKYEDYDMIGKNLNNLEFISSQVIDVIHKKTLGQDDKINLKASGIEEDISNIPPENCIDKNISEYSIVYNSDVDNKLFNILAMDTSIDIFENNFSQNILNNINPDKGAKIISQGSEIININSVKSANDIGRDILLPKTRDNSDIYKGDKTDASANKLENKKNELKNIEIISKDKSSNNSVLKSSLSNIKLLKKVYPNNISSNIYSKSIVRPPVGIIQLKLKSLSNTKKEDINFMKRDGEIVKIISHKSKKSLPDLNHIKVPISGFHESLSKKLSKESHNHNSAKIAKITISVNSPSNYTLVSIISSNQVNTTFKVNTCNMMNAVTSITEDRVKHLDLKKHQLIETANMGLKLLSIHSHLMQKKKKIPENSNKNPESFEINHFVQEITVLSSRPQKPLDIAKFILTNTIANEKNIESSFSKCSGNEQGKKTKRKDNKKIFKNKAKSSNENVSISLLHGAPPTMVSVPSVLDALSGPSSFKINLIDTLVNCDGSSSVTNTLIKGTKRNKADEKTNKALIQLGINPNSLSASIDSKGNRRWVCPIASCLKQFPKVSFLKVHILNHKGIRPYKCSYENCDWSFYTSFKLKRHLETHLKRRDFVCTEPNCSRRFTTIYNLNTHRKVHQKPNAWSCSVSGCDQSYHTRKALEMHMRKHADVTPSFMCSVEGCPKAYFTPNSLTSHMRSHNKEEYVTCHWSGCGKKFKQPCKLKIHMRIHTGQKPYVCNYEGCNWRFQCASKLSRHQRKHTNDRKFPCPICMKAFLRSEHLKEHHLTHTGVRNFHCPITGCDAKFTAKSSLYVHLKKHKTQKSDDAKFKKYQCPSNSCDKSFGSKLSLQKHMLLTNHSSVATSESNHLDYITLLGDKETGDQLPSVVFSSSFELSKQTLNSFIPLSFQSNTAELQPTSMDVTPTLEKRDQLNSPGFSNLSADGNVLMIPEGLFTFSECEPLHSAADLGFPDLPPKESFSKPQSKGFQSYQGSSASRTDFSKGSGFQDSSAARTDFLGNIILSQRAKRRQQLNVSRKITVPSQISKGSYANDLILPSIGTDVPSMSLNFQPTILPVDGISGSLYEDALITRDLGVDPSHEPQSTINLRDLE